MGSTSLLQRTCPWGPAPRIDLAARSWFRRARAAEHQRDSYPGLALRMP